jgi:uncharacterized protein
MEPFVEERKHISTRLWHGGELKLMELSTLWLGKNGPILQGQVTGHKDMPFALHYRVECDEAWRTRSVRVELDTPPRTQELRITVNDAQQWFVNGEHRKDLDGLIDVDIQVTPSTNTLPIRRLQVEAGKTYEVTSAWVQIPSLLITPLPQQYACVDAAHLHYRSGTFTAGLEVDEHGLVESYGRFWRRVDARV